MLRSLRLKLHLLDDSVVILSMSNVSELFNLLGLLQLPLLDHLLHCQMMATLEFRSVGLTAQQGWQQKQGVATGENRF